MTPQPALVPSAEPLTEVGPVLVPEPAAAPSNVLQFPAPAGPLAASPVAVAPHAISRGFLLGEFVTAFVALPLLLSLNIATALPRLPMLWVAAAYCIFLLLRDPGFDRRQLWNAASLRSQLPQVLALFAAGVVVVSALIRVYEPALFLSLPRLHPRFWAFVMVTYPIFSVYPQGLVYRTFLLHRYRPIFQPEADGPPVLLIFASAVAFALMHLVFHNWIAVALTFPGGILFARHYLNSKSLCVSSIEHALYGCFLFTIGLGQYFYLRIG